MLSRLFLSSIVLPKSMKFKSFLPVLDKAVLQLEILFSKFSKLRLATALIASPLSTNFFIKRSLSISACEYSLSPASVLIGFTTSYLLSHARRVSGRIPVICVVKPIL